MNIFTTQNDDQIDGWYKAEPERGDLIRVKRYCGVYFHEGIYVSDGEVIHFSGEPGESKRSAKVIKTDLETFLEGGVVEVKRFSSLEDRARFPKDEVVKRARRALKDQSAGKYNVILNNCEHFANNCVFGKKISEQLIDKIFVAPKPCVDGGPGSMREERIMNAQFKRFRKFCKDLLKL